MDAAVAAEEVSKAFPHGAIVVDEGMGMHYPIVDLQVEMLDGAPTLLGWALPTKDLLFDLSSAQVRPDGWLVTRNGDRCLLKPQTKDEENAVRITMGYLD